MCQDLASDFSWTRLPTQLIMIFMSKIFNIKLEVVSNLSNYVNIINANSDSDHPTEILLGHIGESHYVPLMWRTGASEDDKELYHEEYKTKFFEWAYMMEQSVNMSYQHRTTEGDATTRDSKPTKSDKNSITIEKDPGEKIYADVTQKVQTTDGSSYVNYE